MKRWALMSRWLVGLTDFVEKVGEGGGAGVEVLELGGVAVDLFLNGLGFGEGGFCFFVEGDAFDVDAFLWEVADAVVLWFVNFSGVLLEDTADAFHEGGLASTIVASEGDALLVSDGEGEVFENDAGSKFNAEVFDGKHAGGVGERSLEENQKPAKIAAPSGTCSRGGSFSSRGRLGC